MAVDNPFLQQIKEMMMFQYEKDLKNTTRRIRQIRNSEYSTDIKKQNQRDKKKKV